MKYFTKKVLTKRGVILYNYGYRMIWTIYGH